MSQFDGDTTEITATVGSPFYKSLGCTETTSVCTGTVEAWLNSSFPDFSVNAIKWDALYLVLVIFASRVITFIALTTLNYKAN